MTPTTSAQSNMTLCTRIVAQVKLEYGDTGDPILLDPLLIRRRDPGRLQNAVPSPSAVPACVHILTCRRGAEASAMQQPPLPNKGGDAAGGPAWLVAVAIVRQAEAQKTTGKARVTIMLHPLS